MLVQTKNKNWYIVQRDITHDYRSGNDILIRLDEGCFLDLNEFTNDMICDGSSFNIIKVAKVHYLGEIFKHFGSNANIESIEGFTIIWQREDQRLTQLNTLVTNLQTQLQEAQEEIKRIRGEHN